LQYADTMNERMNDMICLHFDMCRLFPINSSPNQYSHPVTAVGRLVYGSSVQFTKGLCGIP
jgi:hypothetical protein